MTQGACDIVIVDVVMGGGMTEGLRVVTIAGVLGIPVVVKARPPYGYHLQAARLTCVLGEYQTPKTGNIFILRPHVSSRHSHFVLTCPFYPGLNTPLYGGLLATEPKVEAGTLSLESGPGFGVELAEDVVLRRPYRESPRLTNSVHTGKEEQKGSAVSAVGKETSDEKNGKDDLGNEDLVEIEKLQRQVSDLQKQSFEMSQVDKLPIKQEIEECEVRFSVFSYLILVVHYATYNRPTCVFPW